MNSIVILPLYWTNYFKAVSDLLHCNIKCWESNDNEEFALKVNNELNTLLMSEAKTGTITQVRYGFTAN